MLSRFGKKIAAPQFHTWSPTALLSVALSGLTNVDRTGNSIFRLIWPQPLEHLAILLGSAFETNLLVVYYGDVGSLRRGFLHRRPGLSVTKYATFSLLVKETQSELPHLYLLITENQFSKPKKRWQFNRTDNSSNLPLQVPLCDHSTRTASKKHLRTLSNLDIPNTQLANQLPSVFVQCS